jgi:cellulose biosynthesis protein BcsQ
VLQPLRDEYDLLILDCPPSVSLVSENVLHVADTVLSPLIPTTLSVRTLDQLTAFVHSVGKRPRLLGFFSMVDRRKRLHRDLVEQLPVQRDNIASTAIPALSLIEQMAVRRAPVPHFAPRSLASRCYEQLFSEAFDGRLPVASAESGQHQ